MVINNQIITVILIGAISLILSIPAVAKNELKSASVATEIELTNSTLKTVTVRLKNAGNESVVLATLRRMVQDILNHYKLGIIKLPVAEGVLTTPMMKVVQHLEIVIDVESSLEAQPYKVSITLQEVGTQGLAYFFAYKPDKPDQIYQKIKDYLVKRLNLQQTGTRFSKLEEKPSIGSKVVNPSHSISAQLGEKTQPPSSQTTDNNSPVVRAPKHVSPKAEVQLKNMTPTVKSISVKLQGTARERNILNLLRDMVNKIVNSSRLGVYRVPVPGEPISSPALKVHENLEIVIGAKSPEKEGLPYDISITLQEKDTHGVPKNFKCEQDYWGKCFEILKAYLTEQLNLQEKD